MKEYYYPEEQEEDEESIDFMALAKTLWSGRKTIMISVAIAAVFGVFVALFTPKQYTVSTVIVPQMDGSKSKLGGLSSLASLAGINMDMAQAAEISPLLYPQIVSSTPFKLELMKAPIRFSDVDKPVSLFDYYTIYSKPSVLAVVKKYTLGLPGLIIGALKSKEDLTTVGGKADKRIYRLTEDEYKIAKVMEKLVGLEAEPKEGYLTLTVSLHEPVAAAQLAQKAQELLQREIIKFKVEKAKSDLAFIQERYNIAKAQAEGYQISIAQNTDRYKDLTSAVPQVTTTRVQARYGIANTVFQELAKQLEQAKIQVNKDTPTFTVIQPVTIPNEKSGSGKMMILIIWLFLGGIAGVGIVFGKPFIANLKAKWNEPETDSDTVSS